MSSKFLSMYTAKETTTIPNFGLLNSPDDFDVVGRIVETVVTSDTRVCDVINDVSG